MKAVFADTSFFIGLMDASDQYHDAAHAFIRSNRFPMITSSAVIIELGGWFSKGSLRPLFSLCLAAIAAAPIDLIYVDSLLQRRGIDLFQSRPDKNWSLTDCLSFLIMNDRGLIDAATTDGHFQQAGLNPLLRNQTWTGRDDA